VTYSKSVDLIYMVSLLRGRHLLPSAARVMIFTLEARKSKHTLFSLPFHADR